MSITQAAFWRAIVERLEICKDPGITMEALYGLQKGSRGIWTKDRPPRENCVALLGNMDLIPKKNLAFMLYTARRFIIKFFCVYYVLPAALSGHLRKSRFEETWPVFLNDSKRKCIVVPLDDCVSQERLRIPVRYRGCRHVQCIEGVRPLELPHRCPICHMQKIDAYIDTSIIQVLNEAPKGAKNAILEKNLTFTFDGPEPSPMLTLKAFQKALLKLHPSTLQTVNTHLQTEQAALENLSENLARYEFRELERGK